MPRLWQSSKRAWYLQNAEQEIAKTLSWCRANPEKVKTHARRTYLNHQESRQRRGKKAYEIKKDQITEANRLRYAQDPAFRAKKLQQCRASQQKRSEALKEYRRIYRRNNPMRLKALANIARARKANAPGKCTHEQWLAILRLCNFHCSYCLHHESEVGKLTMDHVTPLSRGGSNHPLNIAPACKSCNSSKNNRTMAEYLAGISVPKALTNQK